MMGSRNIVIAHGLGMIVVAWCMALFARFNFEVPPLPFLASGFNALPIVLIVQGLLLWKFGYIRLISEIVHSRTGIE